MKYILFALCVLLTVAGCTSQTHIPSSSDTSDISVYYTFGVGEKNTFDSANNLYIKDLICNGTQEYTLVLIDEEKEEIKQTVILSSFFDLEEGYKQQGDILIMCSPSSAITLTITMDGKTHSVHREECAGGYGDILSIENALNQIIQEYEQKMNVPEPPCGYI
jgi:hypothetical protein